MLLPNGFQFVKGCANHLRGEKFQGINFQVARGRDVEICRFVILHDTLLKQSLAGGKIGERLIPPLNAMYPPAALRQSASTNNVRHDRLNDRARVAGERRPAFTWEA